MEQRTDEWLQARVGKLTASKFKAVLARLKNGQPAQARHDYLMDVVCERLTGRPTQTFVSAAMQWGTDLEPVARQAYIDRRGLPVVEVGFMLSPFLDYVGGSPDGLVPDLEQDEQGCIEIKAPTTKTHVETILEGMPDEHYAQVQGVIWVTGSSWCDFISFDPRMDEKHQLYVQRVERDEDFISMLQKELVLFNREVEDTIEQINRKVSE